MGIGSFVRRTYHGKYKHSDLDHASHTLNMLNNSARPSTAKPVLNEINIAFDIVLIAPTPILFSASLFAFCRVDRSTPTPSRSYTDRTARFQSSSKSRSCTRLYSYGPSNSDARKSQRNPCASSSRASREPLIPCGSPLGFNGRRVDQG